jgi:hypothetical protein
MACGNPDATNLAQFALIEKALESKHRLLADRSPRPRQQLPNVLLQNFMGEGGSCINERFVVERRGEPAVVIMSWQDFIRTAPHPRAGCGKPGAEPSGAASTS